MAYYSGQASSYAELQNVLVNACVAQGWTWADGILSKDLAFVRPYISTEQTTQQGPGLCIQGGTGKSGTTLINPSACCPRIGAIGTSPTLLVAPVFPLKYQLFIFNNPNEVYLIIRYDIDRFMFLSFGYSTISGCGLWLCGTCSKGFCIQSYNFKSFSITETAGGNMQISPTQAVATGFFWQTYQNGVELTATTTCFIGFESIGWVHPQNSVLAAVYTIQPLISILPSNWSSNSPLLAIQPIYQRSQNKQSIVAEIQNARYMRIDNYEPEQIITLGNDRWMVLPFHKKNITVRNGGNNIDHSGTFGWAIRYEGP